MSSESESPSASAASVTVASGGRVRVVVIGAGMSGLAVAHELREYGDQFQVTVVEGRNRIGGRVHALPFGEDGSLVDLGGEVVPLVASSEFFFSFLLLLLLLGVLLFHIVSGSLCAIMNESHFFY